MKQRTHRLTITVTFNKPIGRRRAAEMAHDTIHGTFYPGNCDHEPGVMYVRSIKTTTPKEARS